jgi:mycothiol system anti-sigma-R factor
MENAQTNCRQVLAQIYLYIDGELERPTIAGIEQHMQSCLPCHLRADWERDFKSYVGTSCREAQAPVELLQRIRALLEEM